MTGDAQLFDVCGPLPTGVTVLEASAGTGKTFTIAALAARYVAAGTPLDQLLLVTFTRMATGELRERVRERLVTAERGLFHLLASGATPPPGDEVLALLATGTEAEVEVRRRRLAAALADFDAATIATTHGFCQHILTGLGVAGDVGADSVFVDDARDLVDEVVDDLYIRRFHADTGKPPPMTRRQAVDIGRVAVNNPQARLQPAVAPGDSEAAMRVRLAVAVRSEVERRKRRSKLITYDDLLTRLAATLRDPVRGPVACRRLRARYRVALVDEFQDTDPIQWEIMRRAFAEGGSTLVLIGDPKQAIYAFRGADVFAYLEAARSAGTRATLGVNWRSDQDLLDAYDALLGGTHLGHPGISYRTVSAAPANRRPRLLGAPVAEALRFRVVHRGDGQVNLTDRGYAHRPSAQALVARDLAADVVRLLASGAEIVARDGNGAETARAPVTPSQVAVLVRTHKQAAVVQAALSAAGVPAVVNGAGSVFATEVARQWLTLLEALERPASSLRAHAGALTPFLGWTASAVAAAGDEDWEQVHARLHQWAAVLRDRGVAALVETVSRSQGLPGRLLGGESGERSLTDLRHVGHLLHAEANAHQLGITALAAWLRQRIREAADEGAAEEQSRRLESDAEAVQVLTVHRSKGLEFPVVYFPYLYEATWIPGDTPPVFHADDTGDSRTINVGGPDGPDYLADRRRFEVEQRGEDLRLAYVALTRARHQAVVWWAGTWEAEHSPLGRILFARDEDGNVAPDGPALPEDRAAVRALEAVAAAAPGRVAVERVDAGPVSRWSGLPVPVEPLAVSSFDRTLDESWRRTSYTAITAAAHGAEPVVASEVDDAGKTDEPDAVVELPAPAGLDLHSVPSPLAAMPGGTAVGTLVHSVLEHVDFTAPDLAAALRPLVEAEHRRRRVELGPLDEVVTGLQAALETPLGPLAGDLRLADVPPTHRLDELAFELPLAGGDSPSGAVTLRAIADVVGRHLGAGDPLVAYPHRLAEPGLVSQLRGFLSGHIDLVLRVEHDGGPRFVVIDYKTNWLGVPGEPLTAAHYHPAAMAEAMQRAHYPLQALLYDVALHRYLRWRLPGYDPEAHLGGVLYLFLRGMTGAAAPRVDGQPCGVFAWSPPPAMVVELSDVLDRGEEVAA